jgi:patatin-like phospholipase/acyl hydrolase
MFGDVNIKDAITEEVMIVSFEYNSHEPRLFTKWAAENISDFFNVSLADASEASSSAPVYFNPKVIGNQVLIDGGVIANEPAFYAYLFSKEILNKTSIRIVSIGTGQVAPVLLTKKINALKWLQLASAFITSVA